MEVYPDSKLACDHTESCKDVASNTCNFVCGRLMYRTEANHANPSLLEVYMFLNEKMTLQMQSPFVCNTYLDEETTECILNQGRMTDALTANIHEIIQFRIYLPADVRNSKKTFSTFSRSDRQFE
jgi:hypothetical protein